MGIAEAAYSMAVVSMGSEYAYDSRMEGSYIGIIINLNYSMV